MHPPAWWWPVLGLTIATIVVGMPSTFSPLGAKIGRVPLPSVYFTWRALTLVSRGALTRQGKVIYIRHHGRWR
jgi:hypothetical protein